MRLLRIALFAGLFSIASVAVYAWMLKLSADLGWDEAMNFRVYARSPLTAVALYHEPNNHPLDSFLKSLFFSVIGFDEPATLKITGFLYVAGYLAIGLAAFRRFLRNGWLIGAALLVPLLLLTRAISYQAVELRGYFLSVVLQVLYLFLLCRDTGLLGAEAGAPGAPSAPAREWTRRTLIKYAALSGLIAWTLPSNVLALVPMWLVTALAFPASRTAFGQTWLRRLIALGFASGLAIVILYAPILLTLALKISLLHNTSGGFITDRSGAIVDEIGIIVSQLAPRVAGAEAFHLTKQLGGRSLLTAGPVLGFACLLGALVLGGIFAARRPAGRAARLALATLGAAVVVRVAFAAVVFYQTRVRTALVAPLVFGVLLLAWELTRRLSPKVQLAGALAIMAGSFFAVPVIVSETGVGHPASEVAAFLKAYCRPESRNVLVVHAALENAIMPVIRVFGPEHVVGSERDLNARVRGQPETEPAESALKRWLRERVAPEQRFYPIAPSKVETLVFIDKEDDLAERAVRLKSASEWKRPELDAIKARLSRHSTFDRGPFHLSVFEAP